MSHTPGPWVVDGDDDGLFIRMEATGGKDEYLAIYASANPEQREADAFLIAAAPDLLAVAEELLALVEEFIECGFVGDPRNPEASMNGEDLQRARAAITKARGEA